MKRRTLIGLGVLALVVVLALVGGWRFRQRIADRYAQTERQVRAAELPQAGSDFHDWLATRRDVLSSETDAAVDADALNAALRSLDEVWNDATVYEEEIQDFRVASVEDLAAGTVSSEPVRPIVTGFADEIAALDRALQPPVHRFSVGSEPELPEPFVGPLYAAMRIWLARADLALRGRPENVPDAGGATTEERRDETPGAEPSDADSTVASDPDAEPSDADDAVIAPSEPVTAQLDRLDALQRALSWHPAIVHALVRHEALRAWSTLARRVAPRADADALEALLEGVPRLGLDDALPAIVGDRTIVLPTVAAAVEQDTGLFGLGRIAFEHDVALLQSQLLEFAEAVESDASPGALRELLQRQRTELDARGWYVAALVTPAMERLLAEHLVTMRHLAVSRAGLRALRTLRSTGRWPDATSVLDPLTGEPLHLEPAPDGALKVVPHGSEWAATDAWTVTAR